MLAGATLVKPLTADIDGQLIRTWNGPGAVVSRYISFGGGD
jgi:hypothetical protein